LKAAIRQVSLESPDPKVLSEAARIIQGGGVVAFPTDTFYGLAANPFDPKALARLFKIKGRASSKPILLLINGKEMLEALVEPPSLQARQVMGRFWPGPLTLVLNAKKHVPEALIAGSGKIGLRFPDARLATQLISKSGLPLTATSANPSGASSPETAEEVCSVLGDQLDLVLDGGRLEPSSPSSLLDLTAPHPKLLREGRISRALLTPFLQ